MKWKNTADAYGAVAMLFHWAIATAFLLAYVVVYYVIWVVDPQTSIKPALFGLAPDQARIVPILNIHWILGICVGVAFLPRLLWRIFSIQPTPISHSRLERLLAIVAHVSLYVVMVVMPLTGYMNTDDPTRFGLFTIPSFQYTSFFSWISSTYGVTWQTFSDFIWSIHRFLGKWVVWPLIAVHASAAIYHHAIRKDATLRRMLPRQGSTAE